MAFDTKPCEDCRGYGHGVHPNGSDLDCETCDGEGSVCAECGGSRCAEEGECVGADDRRREAEQRSEYEERQRAQRALIGTRVIALNVALELMSGAHRAASETLAGLRDELASEATELDRIAKESGQG